ncbi:MAG: hypothetical protein V7745_07565 [Pseudomonadales bacterium]
MIELVDFKAEHFKEMDLQEGQRYLSSWVSDAHAKSLEDQNWSYSALDDGVPVCSAGVVEMWQGRGIAWAYVSGIVTPRKFITVHRMIDRFLNGCYLHRIEMTVDCEFDEGHRWAKMLGFDLEAERMVAYRPDGGDCALYARTR